MLNGVVGETEADLSRDRALETTMDNLLLKALIEASGAEMAFSNGWRYIFSDSFLITSKSPTTYVMNVEA